MFANNYRESNGGLANTYQPNRKLANDVDALLDRAASLETDNSALVVRVTLLETEKTTLEARLAALEQWAKALTQR